MKIFFMQSNQKPQSKGLIRAFCFFIMACAPVFGAAAQDNPEGRIFYVHGIEFALIIGEQQETYEPGILNSSRLSLGNGDMLRTGPGSFAELQILPHGTGIKAAENTLIQFAWNDSKVPVITILYGRIRVVSGYSAPVPAVIVTAGNGISTVQNGDFSFDYVISPGGSLNNGEDVFKPKLQVYDFSGLSNIALVSTETGISSDNWPSIQINEYEAVSLEVNSSLALIERKPLDRGMVDYWNQYNFRGTPPLAMPDAALTFAEAAPVPAVTAAAVQESPERGRGMRPVPEYNFTESQRRLTRIKNALIISGLSMTVAGVSAQAIGYADLGQSDPALARFLANWGFIPIGIGISVLIASLFFNPAFP
jgi:hypothetical protein